MVFSPSVLVLAALISLAVGYLVGWLSQRGRVAGQARSLEEAAAESKRLQAEAARANAAAAANDATAKAERERAERLHEERARLVLEKQAVETRATAAETELVAERKQSAEKLALLNDAREQLSNQFKTLAQDILEEKSKRFTEQNQANIGSLLNPLREKILEFQAKVEEVQKEGTEGRLELRFQIGELKTLNERLSHDAENLVSALKGSSKVQGDWGEFILESLLEASGLREGHEYLIQESLKREDGKGARLDVVVNLPGGRHLVIDSKLSLTDYSEYCNSEEGLSKDAALARHLASVRTHLKGLSERNYQTLYGLRSLDFVVMFVPIEPAFMLAIARDPKLWSDAWGKNVLLVSPSTLLFVIRTVAHLWKQEQQTQNARDIARRGAALYDKFVGFVEDMKVLGNRLSQARDSYDSAFGKLSSGQANLVKQAELLRELGVKPKKTLPIELIAAATEDGGQQSLALAAVAEEDEESELEGSLLPEEQNPFRIS
jgi:DNA recombination protein RmuC